MKVASLLKNYKVSFLYFFLIILLLTGADFVFLVFDKKIKIALIGLVCISCLLLAPIVLFRNRIRLYAWLLFPIIFFVPFTIACMVFYHVPINDSMVVITINTNTQEALELISGYILPFLILLATIFFLYFLLLIRLPYTISLRSSVWISLISIFIIFSSPFIIGRESTYSKQLKGIYYSYYPTSFFYSVGIVLNQYNISHASAKQRQHFKFNSVQSPAISKKQVYILVLGESSRYDHWSINGYWRNTNPKLSNQQNLITFSNTHTNAYITEYSVPLIITGVNPISFEENYKRKSIIDAFKEAGFKTYWFSNQIDDGNISLHRDNADKKILMLQSSKSTINIHQDVELLSKLEAVLSEPGDKKFIIMHFQGSHYDYSVRYPNEFDFFKPSNKTIKTLSNDYKSKETIINSYDNSILYTDYILDSVISIVKSKPVVSSVLYISDHGENLFDDDRHLSQHAYPIPSKYIAHIPFFIWYSDDLHKISANKIALLEGNKNKKSTAQNVFFTYTELCGIKIPGTDSLLSLCNPTFKETTRNILGGAFKIYNSDSLR
jgi:glucan phosphoethanolaminetransferase (alkaline phosphatase superfamily)